jgi:CHAD domain-containing protein
MGYKLSPVESFSEGIKRITSEQVDRALENLRATRYKDEAVHDARVCVKKIRAVLRMIQDSLGKKAFEEEDIAYRDVARLLSKVRDSTAMLETLDKLTGHFADQLEPDAFDEIRAKLQRSKSAQRRGVKTVMSAAAQSLRKARERIEGWTKLEAKESLTQGLKRTYRSGLRSFKVAYDDGSVDSFHEWRKHVKHLLYQTRMLQPLWGRVMKAFRRELDALGELLSEHHDIALLRDTVTELLSQDNEVEIEVLIALVDQRRGELEVQARQLGARIFAETPHAFVSRNEAYWKTLRSEARDASMMETHIGPAEQ